jgi:TrmH family RNA methyltransferase
MLPVYKLSRLPAGQRRRKLLLAFTSLEKGLRDSGLQAAQDPEEYLKALVSLALEDPKIGDQERVEIITLVKKPHEELDPVRLCNFTRNALLAANGTFPAEWDLVVPGQKTGADVPERRFSPGVSVYAEDIRSPFNLGSIFRTAEAFGAEKVMISPLCVPPAHPRARRSAMGCIDFIPWEQLALEDIPGETPVFALETGGTPIDEFDFPQQGIVIIGSEELGISPEGLARATFGRVSIPMTGIKASLNVGVAFGILMQAWTSYLV